MKRRYEDFAVAGGRPEFGHPLHVGQINLPPWEQVEQAFRGIFSRRYFANNGPLVQELDRRLAEFVGARHAVAVTNGTMALMILARSLGVSGGVLVPAFTFPATVQALQWAGLQPVLCDVDYGSHMLSAGIVESRLRPGIVAILGVHAWGRACDPVALEELARRRNLALIFDACHGIGCSFQQRSIGTFGKGEAFSLHATKIMNACEGGFITTNDDAMADRLRTMRSFHVNETFTRLPVRTNGKMSEAQAAFALLSLDQFAENVAANRARFESYRSGLAGIDGIRLVELEREGERSNFQYIVVDVDEATIGLSRDEIVEILFAENIVAKRYFWPGLHKSMPGLAAGMPAAALATTERLCRRLLQLPSSQVTGTADVERICRLLQEVVTHAGALSRRRSSTE